jgi:hypothetical protein
MTEITAEQLLYVSGVLYGVGICFGITLCFLILFLVKHAKKRNVSTRLIYLMAVVDMMYYHVKIPQLNGVNNDCGTQEALSVLFYLGSNLILYIFYVYRYVEVYEWNAKRLIPVIILIGVFATAIPVSIFSNVTTITKGVCTVRHPPISAYFPSATCFVISGYMMVLFLLPLLKGNFKDSLKKSVAKSVFITNTIAMVSTVLFNATLSSPVGQYAPLTSSFDLMINYVMVCLPYFVTHARTSTISQKGSGGGTQKNSLIKSSV